MGTRLFVGNLAYSVTEQDLRETFTSEGIEVRSVRVALDRESGRPRGFAFVETATDDGAKQSIEKLAGRVLQGRPLVIEEAQARAAGPRTGGPPRPFGGPRPGGPPGAGPGGGGGGGSGGGGGGFGGGPPRGNFGGPRPGPGGPGGGPPRSFGGPPRPPGATTPGKPDVRVPRGERRERPEKKRSSRPKPEERERGNWRWKGTLDED